VSTDLWRRVDTPVPPAEQRKHPAWHAVEPGPIITGAVFAAGALANMGRVPALLAGLTAAVIAGSITAAGWVMARSAAVAEWVTAAAVCASGWMAYAAIQTPWGWPAIGGLVLPAIALIVSWAAIMHREQQALEAERRRRAEWLASQANRKWPDLLHKIGQKGVVFVSRTDMRPGFYDIRLRLPDHGRVTFKTLRSHQEKLEVAARARRGSLQFEQLPGDAAHEVILHVSERDVLAEEIRLPISNRKRSINDGIPVGLFEDGTECVLTFREVATLIVGIRGSGKSTLLNVLIAQLAMCVDVVIFLIDHKFRLAKPWLQPWMEAQTPMPVLDWVATSAEETDLMVDSCLGGIQKRTSHPGDLREKLVPTAREPAVIVICDEFAVVGGQRMGGNKPGEGPTNQQITNKVKKMTILGRSEAIDPILAGQRGTVTMFGDGDLKSQCELRIGLGVATEADARTVIPDNVHIAADLAGLVHPGSGIVQYKNGRVARVKFYRILPEDIAQIAALAGHWRPDPDQRLAEGFGDAYPDRWGRAEWLIGAQVPARSKVIAPPGMDEDEFQRIVRTKLSDVDALGDVAAAAVAVSPPRQRMRNFIRSQSQNGRRGVRTGAIGRLLDAEKMGVSRQTIHNWLNEDEAAGLITHDSHGMWKWAQ
jgi:hypothetical protein